MMEPKISYFFSITWKNFKCLQKRKSQLELPYLHHLIKQKNTRKLWNMQYIKVKGISIVVYVCVCICLCVCVCVCVCENFRKSRSKTNNHHCANTKKTVCKPGGLKREQGMRLRGLLLESSVLWWEGSDYSSQKLVRILASL